MIRKGGPGAYRVFLSPDECWEVAEQVRNGACKYALAARFGCSVSKIYSVAHAAGIHPVPRPKKIKPIRIGDRHHQSIRAAARRAGLGT